MRTWRFPFARVFPPGDPVGHFVIGLAAALNDLLLTNKTMFPPDDPDNERLQDGERLALLRQAIGQIWEAHLLVAIGARDPAIDAFITRFADAYQGDLDPHALVDALRGRTGATAPSTRRLLEVARNSTFHYPKPGDEGLTRVLQALTEELTTGEIVASGQTMDTLRVSFADEVLLRLTLTDSVAHDRDRLGELFKDVAWTTIAIIQLAQVAIDLWVSERGGNTVVLDENAASRDP